MILKRGVEGVTEAVEFVWMGGLRCVGEDAPRAKHGGTEQAPRRGAGSGPHVSRFS